MKQDNNLKFYLIIGLTLITRLFDFGIMFIIFSKGNTTVLTKNFTRGAAPCFMRNEIIVVKFYKFFFLVKIVPCAVPQRYLAKQRARKPMLGFFKGEQAS